MLSEDQLNIIGGAIVPIFQGLEQDVITDVARRVKKTMSLTRTAELMAMSMLELGFSAVEIMRKVMETIGADEALQAKIVENTIEYKKEIQAGIRKAISMAKTVGDELIGDAGNMAWIEDMRIWESAGKQLTDDSALGQIIEQYRKRTEGTLKNITQSAGFKTKTALVPVRDLYQKTMDKVLTEFVGGVFNSDTCVRNAVHELAQSGIRSVDYESGRSYQLDTAARMCIQTASGQVAAGVMDDNMKKTDSAHLVEVSRHWGARNVGKGYKNHEEWQGKVYSVDGQKHPEEEKRLGYPILDLETVTGYDVHTGKSEVEGLHGINCRHAHYVFFEGISDPQDFTPEPPPKVIDGKKMDYFHIYQEQRRRERNIRALKREKEALKNLGMDTAEIDRKIKDQTKAYYDFCKKAGVNPQPSRLRVEPNTSDLRKTQAWQDYEAERDRVMGSRSEIPDRIQSNVAGAKNHDIMDSGSAISMNLSSVNMPIEQRNTGKGNPNAILTHGVELNNRQKVLLEALSEYDTRKVFPKKSVSMKDLAALTAVTGQEFAMFTKGKNRLIIRGNSRGVNVTVKIAEQLRDEGYKWSGHTHPGIDLTCLGASDGDRAILGVFKQEVSSIYNAKGQYEVFGKE